MVILLGTLKTRFVIDNLKASGEKQKIQNKQHQNLFFLIDQYHPFP